MDAHGGLDQWRRFKTVSAHLVQGGVLWKLKGQDGVLNDVRLSVDLRTEWASHRPFLQGNQHTSFQPDRIAIETSDGHVVEELLNPRESFKGSIDRVFSRGTTMTWMRWEEHRRALCVGAQRRLRNHRPNQTHDVWPTAGWECGADAPRRVDRRERDRIQLGLRNGLRL